MLQVWGQAVKTNMEGKVLAKRFVSFFSQYTEIYDMLNWKYFIAT